MLLDVFFKLPTQVNQVSSLENVLVDAAWYGNVTCTT